MSDYGQLQAYAAIARQVDPTVTKESIADQLVLAGNRYFSSALVPIAYPPTLISYADGVKKEPNTACGVTYHGLEAAPNAWVPLLWQGGSGDRTSRVGGNSRRRHRNIHIRLPPETVAGPMFTPPSQGGYGIEKTSWFWGLPNQKRFRCN